MPTGIRVLPWRRQLSLRREEITNLLDTYVSNRPKANLELVTEAFEFAELQHRGQKRVSGEPYITHPIAVATILARYGVDEETVCAALLHDVVEDCDIPLSEIGNRFGPEVEKLVDGCTKLTRASSESKEERKAETLRKVILAMAEDLRVILIKLADRLHNMRTLAGMSAEHQQRTAQETMEVYAPLAHRLGMAEIRQLLEDLCFAAMEPEMYAEIDYLVTVRAPEREIYLAQVTEQLSTLLRESGIEASVYGRPKHLWSIYEKMVIRGRPFDEIHDLVGIRVVVDQKKDCYAAVGTVHAMWPPVPNRFKDYIARKKFNTYQSIHTTVVGPQGKTIEIQIRTKEMHRAAEFGVAAHYSYKEKARSRAQGVTGLAQEPNDFDWLGRIVDWQRDEKDPTEFLSSLKMDLSVDEVFVFSPKGRLVTLPMGATPVDFAYAIHTEVGHRCIGAKVNSKLVALDEKLRSGDTVEIVTAKVGQAGPRAEWLEFVTSRPAQHKIRSWLSKERRVDDAESGRDLISEALVADGLSTTKVLDSGVIDQVAEELGFRAGGDLFGAVGDGRVSAEQVIKRVRVALRRINASGSLLASPVVGAERGSAHGAVHVEGVYDSVIRLAECCHPAPPDEIEGCGDGAEAVEIHRAECHHLAELVAAGGRVVNAEWSSQTRAGIRSTIVVRGFDRPRLLSDVTAVVAENGVNIISCKANAAPGQRFAIELELEVTDPGHLAHLLERIRAVDPVFSAQRV